MPQINEIISLVKISVTPSSWKLIQNIDKTYTIDYRYHESDSYMPVRSQDGNIKRYKTIKSAMSDIARVHQGKLIQEALIHFIPCV